MHLSQVVPDEAWAVGQWPRLREAWPPLLIGLSALTAPLLIIHGITLTGDRLLGLLAVAAVVALLVLRRPLSWGPVHWAVAAFVGAQLLTSVLNARAWPQGLKFVTVYLLGFACFALTAEAAKGVESETRITRTWIAVGAILGLVGALTATLSNVYQTPLWGSGPALTLFPGTDANRVVFAAKATFDEWNLYSSFLLIPLTMALWLWPRDPRSAGRQWGLVASLGAILFGLVFGLTRAAWLSMAGILSLWVWIRRPGWRRVALLVGFLTLAFLLQGAAIGGYTVGSRRSPPPGVRPDSPFNKIRLSSLLGDRLVEPIKFRQDGNMSGRLAISKVVLKSWWGRPVLGHGAGSINRLSAVLPDGHLTTKLWNGNLILFVLHDSGLVGLGALVALVVAVGRRCWRATRAGASPAAVPLLAMGVALFFGFQFTHGLWLMYPYVYLGLLTALTETGSHGA
jgi:O-antigen ligase